MATGNDMTQSNNDNQQPVDGVLPDTEESGSAQTANNDDNDLIVEGEGDQIESPSGMTEAQQRAAFRAEREKRKKYGSENKLLKAQVERMEQQLEDVTSQVSSVARGKRPDPDDYVNTDDFWTALEQWQSGANKKPKKPQKPETKTNNGEQSADLDEDQEFHLYKSEDDLRKKFKDYDDVKDSVGDQLSAAFNADKNLLMNQISGFSHTIGVDPAKVFYALSKNPSKIREMATNNKPAALRKILTELEGKIKIRERKPIDSKPDNDVSQGGPVDNMKAEQDAAFDKWQKSRSVDDYRALQAVKKKRSEAAKSAK